MALIVDMEMPKQCWSMRTVDGETIRTFCPLFTGCKSKFPYDVDYRPSNCPIKGEIPDEHGRVFEGENMKDNPLTDERGWTVGTPTEDGDYIVCMSDSISTPMHVPCTVRDGKPFISMVYDTKQRTIRAYMPFKPYMR